MISTIILPMTLIAGIYGMNFEENVWPGFKTQWGFSFAIGAMLLTGVGAVAFSAGGSGSERSSPLSVFV